MGDFALSNGLTLTDSGGRDLAASTLNTFTAGNDVKGAWSELIASTAADSVYMRALLDHDNLGIEEFLFDVGVGGAGSEEVIVENMHWSGRDGESPPYSYKFPIGVALGSRVSIRAQGTTGRSVKAGIDLYGGSFQTIASHQSAQGYGIDLVGSRGTLVDPGGTANTKGAWAELDPTTGEDIFGFCMGVGNNDNSTINADSTMLVDLAIGASGSEVVIVEDHPVSLFTTETGNPVDWFGLDIPAGSRISARAQSTNIDATDRLITVCIVGVN